jgi:hypothetical protein
VQENQEQILVSVVVTLVCGLLLLLAQRAVQPPPDIDLNIKPPSVAPPPDQSVPRPPEHAGARSPESVPKVLPERGRQAPLVDPDDGSPDESPPRRRDDHSNDE